MNTPSEQPGKALPNSRISARNRHPREAFDPYKDRAIWMAALFTLTLPAILTTIVILEFNAGAWSGRYAARGGTVQAGGVSGSAGGVAGVSIENVSGAARLYAASCAVCHGPDGEGLKGLGKPLRNSAYVQASSDEELMNLLIEGRMPGDPANTSGALMPPRGAQGLSDDQLSSLVGYLRDIQDPEAEIASTEAWEIKGGGADDADEAGGAAVDLRLTKHPGYELFVSSCAACHGEDAMGITDMGLPLATSGFVRGATDNELRMVIMMGRASWDPANSTGLNMPPKGGNPAITSEQVGQIIEYLRAVQEKALGGG